MTEEKLETLPELVKQHPSTYQVAATIRIQLSVKRYRKDKSNQKQLFPLTE